MIRWREQGAGGNEVKPEVAGVSRAQAPLGQGITGPRVMAGREIVTILHARDRARRQLQ